MEDQDLNVITLIMAAGKGTRMKSNKSKLVQKIYDKELVKRVVELAEKIGSSEIVAVVGYLREQIEEALGDRVKYAYQEELLGTGHTTMQAIPYLKDKKGKQIPDGQRSKRAIECPSPDAKTLWEDGLLPAVPWHAFLRIGEIRC